MIQRYEFRLFAQYRDLLEDAPPRSPNPTQGIVVLRGIVGDAVFLKLAAIESQLRKAGLGGTFGSWRIRRSYTQRELRSGELFLLSIPITHLCAEDYGSIYTESETCRQEAFEMQSLDRRSGQFELVPRMVPCGLCSQQTTMLRVPFRKLSRSRDIIRLYGGELVISDRFSILLTSGSYIGGDIRPAADAGKARSKANASKPAVTLHQLMFQSKPVEVSQDCRFGSDPFDRESEGKYHCSSGEIAGNMLLTPLKIVRSSWNGEDVCRTRVYVGGRQGPYRPYQLLLVSSRLFHAMRQAGLKGFDYEVVELV